MDRYLENDQPAARAKGRLLQARDAILFSSFLTNQPEARATGVCHVWGGRDQSGQAPKGVWGMSGRQKAMKGVEDCDKPGGTVKRVLIPGCPNHHALNP